MFAACNAASEPATDGPDTLAGFIEIRGDTLYITPVEVFMLYDADSGHDFFQDLTPGSIVFIERNDTQKLAELGLTLDNFHGWAYIRPNWHADYHWHYVEQANIQRLSFAITPDTEFVFLDSDRNQRSTNVPEDFLPYLYPTVVHFIDVHDGKVIRLVQEFGFTM
ncbi:MAG: hypothetical protein LBE55_03515 [Clostridiales bacterium]|nr:hypothetical protein [Clostridiales bacterium]